MTIISDTAGYRLRITRADGSGEQILDGSFPELMTVIPDSVARTSAEAAIRAHALAKSRATLDRIRSDDIQRREDAVEAREQRVLADMKCKLDVMIANATARVDAAERACDQAKLDAAPDPDDPESHGDNLQSPLPPSEPAHEERLAAMSAESPPPDAEDALADEGGSAPVPRILAPSDLPAALAQYEDSVASRYGFVRRADYKAWRKQMRQGVAR
jgi:hypothetical protein